METSQKIERGIIVFCNWTVFGLVGLGLLMEGGARDSFLLGSVGVGSIIVGFSGHILVNSIFQQSFTLGETVLGLGLFAIFVLTFIALWIGGGLSRVDFNIGLSLLAVLVAEFLVYVISRYGLRGAFKRFDVIPTTGLGNGK